MYNIAIVPAKKEFFITIKNTRDKFMASKRHLIILSKILLEKKIKNIIGKNKKKLLLELKIGTYCKGYYIVSLANIKEK